MYIVEKKPVTAYRIRRGNPITLQMRKLAVGESFLISPDDPNWTGNQVRNENLKKKACYATQREGDKLRIGRVK